MNVCISLPINHMSKQRSGWIDDLILNLEKGLVVAEKDFCLIFFPFWKMHTKVLYVLEIMPSGHLKQNKMAQKFAALN